MYKYNKNIAFGGHEERNNIIPDKESEYTIINLSKSSQRENHHIPLNDGAYDGGNSQQQFAEAVNIIRKQIQQNNPVFVHCAAGQSRSVSVLSTAIAAEYDEDYEDVQKELMNIRGSSTEPANSLQTKARTYLRHTR